MCVVETAGAIIAVVVIVCQLNGTAAVGRHTNVLRQRARDVTRRPGRALPLCDEGRRPIRWAGGGRGHGEQYVNANKQNCYSPDLRAQVTANDRDRGNNGRSTTDRGDGSRAPFERNLKRV